MQKALYYSVLWLSAIIGIALFFFWPRSPETSLLKGGEGSVCYNCLDGIDLDSAVCFELYTDRVNPSFSNNVYIGQWKANDFYTNEGDTLRFSLKYLHIKTKTGNSFLFMCKPILTKKTSYLWETQGLCKFDSVRFWNDAKTARKMRSEMFPGIFQIRFTYENGPPGQMIKGYWLRDTFFYTKDENSSDHDEKSGLVLYRDSMVTFYDNQRVTFYGKHSTK